MDIAALVPVVPEVVQSVEAAPPRPKSKPKMLFDINGPSGQQGDVGYAAFWNAIVELKPFTRGNRQ